MLIDISLGGGEVEAFALRSAIDLKYLMDGANFVISMMHFNTENNPYVTLGISSKASQDEIRERWKRLMLLYHPDRQTDNKEWFAERAKKVNEAYSSLKNAPDRAAFDKKLAEESFRRHSSRLHPAVSAGAGMHRVAAHHPARRGRFSGKGSHLCKYLPAVIVACYLAAAAVFITSINDRNKSTSLESELQPLRYSGISRSPEGPPSGEAKDDLSKTAGMRPAENERKPGPGTASGHRLSDGPVGGEEASKKYAGFLGDGLHLHTDAKVPASARGEKPEAESAARQAVAVQQRETVRPDPPASRNAGVGQQGSQQTAVPAIARSEVEDFLRRYSESYRNGGLDEFMHFFSKDAVENGRMDYAMIRDSYKRTFSSKIAAYRLDDIDIIIERGIARVSGAYTVSRYAPSGQQMRNQRGRISWTLVKEDNTLKIMEADYDD